jgi:4-hydroxy-3-polyprenylbenzoate decarboxylase
MATLAHEATGDLHGQPADSLAAADLRSVMEYLEADGQLRRVSGADWDLELGAITEMMALRDGPALLFDPVKGYPRGYSVLTNLMNSPRRVARLLGLPSDARGVGIVRAIRERFSAVRQIEPVVVDAAPHQEEVHRGADVNLWEFPSPLWHEGDGGRYIGTACCVVTRDPDAGWINVGTYRLQVHDETTLGLFIERSHHGSLILQRYWEMGQSAPVAVCIGVQPAMLLGGFLAIPWGVSEYGWAGGLIGQPLSVLAGELTGLPVPASSEIVIEGFCPPPAEERRLEGPFGETFGYYASGARDEPVIKVGLVQHRRDPVLAGAPPMRPPGSSSAAYLFRAANVWTEIERSGLPDVRGVWMMPAGSSSLLSVVSIRQRYAGHAKQVAQAAMSGRAGGGQLGRFVIVVDEDIDPSDVDQVLWAVATRCEPETDIDVIRACASHFLDPRLPPEKRAAGDFSSSRAVIIACKPFHWRDRFPREVGTSPELRERILKDWAELFGTGVSSGT